MDQKHILVLHSYNKSMSWVTNIDKAIDDTLKPSQNNYIIHTEYMDTKRIFNKEYLENIKSLYKQKYKNIKFDLILSSDNNAFDFLRENRDELFGDVPTSFCGVNFFKDSDLDGLTNYTGATEEFDARATIDIALKLLPKTKNIFVINDYLTTGRAWEKSIKVQLKAINKNITYAKKSSIEELQQKLKSLPKDTIVLLGVYFKDKNGKYFTYEKIGELISKSSNSPVFCLLEFNLGKGVVGGNVIGGYYQGLAMSNVAKQILNGKKVKDIAVQKKGATKFVFDYNGLVKYNVDLSKLPQDAIILHKPANYYKEHKIVILISISIIILLITIITILLINIKKRKQFEKLLLISQNKISIINSELERKVESRTKDLNENINFLNNLLDSSLQGVVISDINGICVDLNHSTLEMFLYKNKKDILDKNIFDFIAKSSIDLVKDHISNNYTKPYEINLIDSNNKEFPVLMKGKTVVQKDKTLRISTFVSLTELKKKDKLIFEQTKLSSMGEMIGNIAHQWRQPLSAISTSATGIQIEKEYNILTDEELSEHCNTINENVQYLSKTIDDFRDFIKGDRKKIIFNLSKNIDTFLHLVKGSIKSHVINIILDLDDTIEINSYDNELTQCFINILNNAKDALKDKKIKNKYIFMSTHTSETKAIITIKDNAGGIPDNIINKIFEPYFTTKHQSQGTGLGLHMTYKLIVDGMGGTVEAHNVEFKYDGTEYVGAEFIISLPLS